MHQTTRMPRALVVLLSSLMALLAAPALALESDHLPPALGVVGKLHLLVLHFPIALLFAVLAIEAVRIKKAPSDAQREVVGLLLVLTVGAAVLASATGFVYSLDEEFHGNAARHLFQHRLLGFVTAGVTVFVAVFQRMPKLSRLYRPALVIGAALVAVTGHKGGALVHGDNYIFEAFSEHPADDDAPAAASDGDDGKTVARARRPEGQVPEHPDYKQHIAPLFDAACTKCHGAEKRKGGLRLDQKRFAMKGGETGEAIVPNDPSRSLVMKYIAAPPDDEDVMPPKGNLLAQSEIETLRRWIEQGAQWPDG